jgi:diphthine synthase
MLYLIGTGLNAKGISLEGIEALKTCKKIYLENYTVDFPYKEIALKRIIDKKIISVDREFVESLKIIDEARKLDVALLVYGSPLTATTHITLLNEAKESEVKYKVIYSASVLDAVAETGLQLYKFGKIASMPEWKKSFEPDSFMEIVKENESIGAHSLILVDIGLDFADAFKQLEIASEKHKVKLGKLVICQALGTKEGKVLYRKLKDLKEFDGVRRPYCLIIPGKLHFLEKEFLERFS